MKEGRVLTDDPPPPSLGEGLACCRQVKGGDEMKRGRERSAFLYRDVFC